MAWDVSLRCRNIIIILALCSLQIIISSQNQKLKIAKWPGYLDSHLFFELLEPEEISYTFKIRPAKNFGSILNITFYGIDLVMANPLHGCSNLINEDDILGSIALIERGGCSFLGKTLQAEKAGALGVIIMDNDHNNDQNLVDMIGDETDRDVHIPAFFLGGKDGYMIHQTLNRLGKSGAVINIPINVTGLYASRLHRPPWSLW